MERCCNGDRHLFWNQWTVVTQRTVWNDPSYDSPSVRTFSLEISVMENSNKQKNPTWFHFNFLLSSSSMIINLIAYCGKCRKLQGGNQNHLYGHKGTMETHFNESKIWRKNIIFIKPTSSLPSQRETFQNYIKIVATFNFA